MKYTIIAFAVLATVSAFADELPYDVAQVVAERERQVAKLDEQYSSALEKLKVTYTKRGDLAVAVKIDELIKAKLPTDTTSKDLTGEWVFEYKGKPRSFVFTDDGKLTGHYAVSNSAFSADWTRKGPEIIITQRGVALAKLKIGAGQTHKMTFEGGYELTGNKSK